MPAKQLEPPRVTGDDRKDIDALRDAIAAISAPLARERGWCDEGVNRYLTRVHAPRMNRTADVACRYTVPVQIVPGHDLPGPAALATALTEIQHIEYDGTLEVTGDFTGDQVRKVGVYRREPDGTLTLVSETESADVQALSGTFRWTRTARFGRSDELSAEPGSSGLDVLTTGLQSTVAAFLGRLPGHLPAVTFYQPRRLAVTVSDVTVSAPRIRRPTHPGGTLTAYKAEVAAAMADARNTMGWPDGGRYGYDKVYAALDLPRPAPARFDGRVIFARPYEPDNRNRRNADWVEQEIRRLRADRGRVFADLVVSDFHLGTRTRVESSWYEEDGRRSEENVMRRDGVYASVHLAFTWTPDAVWTSANTPSTDEVLRSLDMVNVGYGMGFDRTYADSDATVTLLTADGAPAGPQPASPAGPAQPQPTDGDPESVDPESVDDEACDHEGCLGAGCDECHDCGADISEHDDDNDNEPEPF